MFVLHLDLAVKPDGEAAFDAFYREVFCPAISRQHGFVQTQLLRDPAHAARTHRLVIVFDSEHLQKQWVESDLHRQVASQLQTHIAAVCSADSFDDVALQRSA